jgi:hypothetical protein
MSWRSCLKNKDLDSKTYGLMDRNLFLQIYDLGTNNMKINIQLLMCTEALIEWNLQLFLEKCSKIFNSWTTSAQEPARHMPDINVRTLFYPWAAVSVSIFRDTEWTLLWYKSVFGKQKTRKTKRLLIKFKIPVLSIQNMKDRDIKRNRIDPRR